MTARNDCGTGTRGRYPGESWERAGEPEELGWSSPGMIAAKEYARSINSAAFMLVVDGIIVDEWGETTSRFNVQSIRKSFLSGLYGIHVKEGAIRLSGTMEELGIDDNEPSLTPEEKQARVIDLLKARSGIYHKALYESPCMKANRPKRGSYHPGTFWYYNNWDFNALGSIFDKATGSTIFKEFEKRFADPLQMEDFELEHTRYVRGPESIHPAYPFWMTVRDIARFGLLYLNNGRWRGTQIIQREWVSESTRSHSDAGPAGGFGYMWWIAANGRLFPGATLADDAYAAIADRGHFLLIVPGMSLVLVYRAGHVANNAGVSAGQTGNLIRLILNAGTG